MPSRIYLLVIGGYAQAGRYCSQLLVGSRATFLLRAEFLGLTFTLGVVIRPGFLFLGAMAVVQ